MSTLHIKLYQMFLGVGGGGGRLNYRHGQKHRGRLCLLICLGLY